jgi:DNA-binding IclR family transcriptional regulator
MRLVKGLLERCVEVVELLSAAGAPMRLTDVAQALDLPKGAAHRLLHELCTLGWVEQDGAEGPYRLALRFGLLGNRVLQASGLSDLTQPVLERLAARTRELVRLTVATGDGLVWLGSAQGARPGLVYQPAMDGTLVLHATANGKADGAALGTVSVAGPSLRLPSTRVPELAGALRETASVLASIWPTRAIQGKAIRS